MDQSDTFNDGTGKVCKLIKSLYGLKQEPRCWGEEMERILISLGFRSRESDRCLFTKSVGEDLTILLLYVDDGLVLTTNIRLAEEFLKKLGK